MMRQRIVAEARTWMDTPFHHQACARGAGVDCGQLVVGVGVALGLMPMPGAEWRRYARMPNPRQMRAQLLRWLEPLPAGTEPDAGDVLWMGWRRGLPMHLAIISGIAPCTIVHAYAPQGCVVEHELPGDWLPLVDSWWRYRGVG